MAMYVNDQMTIVSNFYPNFSQVYFRKVNLSGHYNDHCYLRTQFKRLEDNDATNCPLGSLVIHSNEKYCSLLSNETDLSNETGWVYSTGESVFTCLVMSLFSIVGFTLNVIVIMALLKSRSLRKEYLTSFIISLAVTDLAFSTFTMPIIIARFAMQ